MDTIERHVQRVVSANVGGGPGADQGAGLDAVRDEAERFLRAADRAIERALSGDSEEFLRSTRQQGGQ